MWMNQPLGVLHTAHGNKVPSARRRVEPCLFLTGSCRNASPVHSVGYDRAPKPSRTRLASRPRGRPARTRMTPIGLTLIDSCPASLGWCLYISAAAATSNHLIIASSLHLLCSIETLLDRVSSSRSTMAVPVARRCGAHAAGTSVNDF
jgi:hypothetical protein